MPTESLVALVPLLMIVSEFTILPQQVLSGDFPSKSSSKPCSEV